MGPGMYMSPSTLPERTMDGVKATQLQSLRAVQPFLDAQGQRLGTINSSGARQRLDELLTRAEQCLTDQAALMAARSTSACPAQIRRMEERGVGLTDRMGLPTIGVAWHRHTTLTRDRRGPRGLVTAPS